MHSVKANWRKLTLLGGAVAVAGWFGWGYAWGYANQRKLMLIALDTTTGKLAWLYGLADDISRSKGPIAGDGKVVLDACVRKATEYCGVYQIQTLDARSGKLLWSKRQPTVDRPVVRTQTGGERISISYDIARSRISNGKSATIQNNRLYNQLENRLRSIDLTTGAEQWTIPARGGNNIYGMGLVALPDKLAMLKFDSRYEGFLQIIDLKTGKLQQQATITIPKREATRNIIAANNRTLFLETSGLRSGKAPETSADFDTTTITAYDSKTLQPRFRTNIKTGIGGVRQMVALENILLLRDYGMGRNKTGVADESLKAIAFLPSLGYHAGNSGYSK
jgi:polyvinyl alcohol dehydrogenase (cytochrome)